MTRKYKSNFIEVSEEAYKQNWVYRPWPEERSVKKAEHRRAEGARAKAVKILRAVYH